MLKFHHAEIEGFKAISKHREENLSEFTKMIENLKLKKDKLWKASEKEDFDFKSWNLQEADLKQLKSFKEDELESKRRMLSYETF